MRRTNCSGIPARSSATRPKPPLCNIRSVDLRTCSRRFSSLLRALLKSLVVSRWSLALFGKTELLGLTNDRRPFSACPERVERVEGTDDDFPHRTQSSLLKFRPAV